MSVKVGEIWDTVPGSGLCVSPRRSGPPRRYGPQTGVSLDLITGTFVRNPPVDSHSKGSVMRKAFPGGHDVTIAFMYNTPRLFAGCFRALYSRRCRIFGLLFLAITLHVVMRSSVNSALVAMVNFTEPRPDNATILDRCPGTTLLNDTHREVRYSDVPWASWCRQSPANGLFAQHQSFASLKTKDRRFDNFVVTGGTVSCHFDNLRTSDDKVVKLMTFCLQTFCEGSPPPGTGGFSNRCFHVENVSTWHSGDHCNSFEDRASVYFIFGYPIFRWVAETWLHDRVTLATCPLTEMTAKLFWRYQRPFGTNHAYGRFCMQFMISKMQIMITFYIS